MTAPIAQIIDFERFPVCERESDRYQALVGGISAALADRGCAVLTDFIRPAFRELMAREVAEVAHLAYDRIEPVNVYNTDIDGQYPDSHPARIIMDRGNAFVARDLIPESTSINQLYSDKDFKAFIAQCFGLKQIYELMDPYAGLCANVLRPGCAHPWHFDTNEFTVSLLTQRPTSGGQFEYCPNIRTAARENFSDVRGVLEGDGNRPVERLTLRPGDLQLFKGRHSLHRVTEVGQGVERHSVIFAYSEMPGVVGSVERTRQLFGRVDEAHISAQYINVSTDQLTD